MGTRPGYASTTKSTCWEFTSGSCGVLGALVLSRIPLCCVSGDSLQIRHLSLTKRRTYIHLIAQSADRTPQSLLQMHFYEAYLCRESCMGFKNQLPSPPVCFTNVRHSGRVTIFGGDSTAHSTIGSGTRTSFFFSFRVTRANTTVTEKLLVRDSTKEQNLEHGDSTNYGVE